MKVKIAKLVSVVAMAFVLAGSQPADCLGWSIWNPFSSDDKSASKSRKQVSRPAQKPPSTWDKVTSGTKDFFGKIGGPFSSKKPPSRKRAATPYAHPKYPGLTERKKESKSWFDSWFGPKEPEKPKTVGQWMKENKRIDP